MLAQNLRRHCRWLCRQRTPYAPTSAVLNAHFAVPCTTNGHQLIPAQHRTIINDLSSRRKAICNHIVALQMTGRQPLTREKLPHSHLGTA